MLPQHNSFYDVFSNAEKLKIRWPHGARLAVSLVGNLEAWTESLDPKHRRTGVVGGSAPLTRDDARCPYDFKTASENDYGGRTGVWRILRVLKKYNLKGSFNVNALAAIKYPDAVKRIHADGHEVVGHNYAEDIQTVLLSREEEKEEIQACIKIFRDLLGERPYGWLSSGMRHTEHTVELPFTERPDGSFAATVYLDAMLDEDYYGNGVCRWTLTSVGPWVMATGSPAETLFDTDLSSEQLLAEQPVQLFYWKGYYPQSKVDGFKTWGNSKREKFALEARDNLFSMTLMPKKVQP